MAAGSVDPGHGGNKPGATAGGDREADITLSVGLRVADYLTDAGHTIHLTRDADVAVTLAERTAMWNAADLDFVVSLHANSFTNPDVRGQEIWYQDGDPSSEALAAQINRQIAVAWDQDLPNRGLKAGSPATLTNWYTFNKANQPADVLVEMAFISNSVDRELMKPPLHDVWAGAIADGILAYLADRGQPGATMPGSAGVSPPSTLHQQKQLVEWAATEVLQATTAYTHLMTEGDLKRRRRAEVELNLLWGKITPTEAQALKIAEGL
jgi:N-acetylmuramoyl-L-alanine amidase